MIRRFFSIAEAERAFKTLRRLSYHDISRWALAGGFAVEIHCLRHGHCPSLRHLNDIDFVAPAFDCIPETLAPEFLFRHVHPFVPPGKIMLQLVDADTALRIDLFRAYEAIMARALWVDLPSGPIQLISPEDALAHAARLLLDLAGGKTVPSRHAKDYVRLKGLVQPSNVEAAWPDHRRPDDPMTFRQTSRLVQTLFTTRRNLLITTKYSKDATHICPSCVFSTPFALADAKLVLALLGYC